MTAASWSSLFAASLLAAHVLAFFAHRPRLDRRVAAIALAAVAVCVTPIAVLVSSNGRDQLDWIPTPTVDVVRLGVWDWAGHNPVLLVAAAIGVIALVTWRRSSVESWKTVLVCSWLLAPFAATLALSTVQPSFVPRYLVSAAPPLALLAGVGVASLPRRLALVLAALLVAVAGLKLYRYYTVV
jgi:mannosyltransferase